MTSAAPQLLKHRNQLVIPWQHDVAMDKKHGNMKLAGCSLANAG